LKAGAGLTVVMLVAGCAPSLGEHRLETVAPAAPGEVARVAGVPRLPETPYLKVTFSSSIDLATLKGAQLYGHGDRCPIVDPYRLSVVGPYWSDRPLGRIVGGTAQGRQAADDTRPDPATGRFHYVAYVATSQPARDLGSFIIPAYDLQVQSSAICLRVDNPGHYLWPSRSNEIVVPAAMVRTALGERAENADAP